MLVPQALHSAVHQPAALFSLKLLCVYLCQSAVAAVDTAHTVQHAKCTTCHGAQHQVHSNRSSRKTAVCGGPGVPLIKADLMYLFTGSGCIDADCSRTTLQPHM